MPKRLLLADDSVTIQKVVGISFASEDVELTTVDNGDDAIAQARELRPDLILADVVMPGKNGYEVCEAIKADPGLRHIPVLLLTGTFEAFDEQRAQNSGAAGYIAKPFEAQTLVDEVKRLFEAPPPVEAQPPPTPPTPEPAADVASPIDESPDDSFDFFDDDLGDFAPQLDAADVPPTATEAVALEPDDSAFAFGDSELVEFDREPSGSPHENTVAILPDQLDAAPAAAADPTPVPDLADDFSAPGDSGSIDFAFGDTPALPEDDDSLLPVDGGDLAQATVIDPDGASGFDVSSSDLESADSPLVIGRVTTPNDLAPPPEPEPIPEVEPLAAPSAPDPFEATRADAITATPSPEIRANAERIDESVLEVLPGPGEASTPTPVPVADAATADIAARAESVLETITPRLRENLHDTLEKIAWESFSSLSEQIVKRAIERIEAIAWEVIPQMTETLIREEIRQLKGEPPDES